MRDCGTSRQFLDHNTNEDCIYMYRTGEITSPWSEGLLISYAAVPALAEFVQVCPDWGWVALPPIATARNYHPQRKPPPAAITAASEC